MRKSIAVIACGGMLLTSAVTARGEVTAYPAKGQSAERQKKDGYECYEWAKGQTGVDPHAMAGTAPAPGTEAPKRGGAVSGAAKGAAVGALGGAIGGDTGKGAAIGAGVGAAAGAHRRRQAEAQAQDARAQEQAG